MLRKIALGLGVASFAFAGVANASDVRPAAVTLNPAAGQVAGAQLPAPAKSRVGKKNALSPLAIVAIIVVVGGIGGAIASSGKKSSPS